MSLVEAVHSSPFDRADMDEHVLAAVSRLNEAVSLLAVEPLHGPLHHKISSLPLRACLRPCPSAVLQAQPDQIEFWGTSLVRRRSGEAKSFRPKLDCRYGNGSPARPQAIWQTATTPRPGRPSRAVTIRASASDERPRSGRSLHQPSGRRRCTDTA